MFQNLDRLKVFYHVFSLGSVIAAANTLHVSQSAVSQTIQKLEKEVNTPLFTRLHKQLIPTSAGKLLFEIVQPFIHSLDDYLKDLEFAKDQPTGELHIGSPPEFGKTYLPSIIADFRERYPEVTFTLEFGAPEKLLPLLKEGSINCALLDVFLTRSTHIGHLDLYHFKPVVEEKVILVCSKQYHDKHIRNDYSFASLSQQNFINYKKDLQVIRHWFKHHFSKTNINIRDVLTVDSHEAVISAITNNIGMGIVASHLISDKLRDGSVIHIKTSKPEILNSISLVQLQDKIPTYTEKTFENHLINQIKHTISQETDGMKVLDR